MNPIEKATQNPSGKRDVTARDAEQIRETRQRLIRRCAWGGALLAAGVGVAVVFMACGSNDPGTAAAEKHSIESQAAPAAYPSPAPEAAPTSPKPLQVSSVARDSLPPAVRAYPKYATVSPGGVIEVEAEGSPDVSEMVLDDGYGHKQAFTRDAATGMWRVYYRAPMRSVRLGLAVTAKNGVERWRRVWVFVTVEPEPATPPADSTASESHDSKG